MNYMAGVYFQILQINGLNQTWQGDDGWSSFNGWLYMVSYFLICIACFIIPFVIGKFLFRKQVNPYYRRIYFLFGAFIFTTGITFFLDALSVWVPIFTIKAIASLVTGVTSVVTLFYLFRFLPQAFSLRQTRKREKDKDEERFRLLVEEVKDYAIIMIDMNGKVATWNKGAEAINGYTVQEIIGSHISVFYSPDDIAKGEPERNLQIARETGRFGGETMRQRKDGSMFWANCVITALHDDKGELYGYATITQDITERKKLQDGIQLLNEDLERKIEEKTREVIASEKRFRSMIENSHDAISLLNENFESFYRTPATQKVKGPIIPGVKQETVLNDVHPDDKEVFQEMMQYILANPGVPREILFRTKTHNNQYAWAEGFMTNLLHDEDVRGIVSNMRNITEKRLAEENFRKLFKELSDYKEALDKAAIVSITDANGIITHVNENFCIISRYSKEELIGNNYRDVAAAKHSPEELERITHILNTEGIWKAETQHTAKDGTQYWADNTVMPFVDIHGNIYQYISIKTDITALKKVTQQLHELNTELEDRVAQRTDELKESNKALESFSYSVSHDLRAPLRIIDGYSDILLEDHAHQLDDEGRRILDIVMNNARRMGKLIDALLNLSRLGRKELSVTAVDMDSLLNKVINQQVFPRNKPVEIKKDALLPALGDPELLEHVWGNLISNAVKYSSKVDHPLVEINSVLNDKEVIYSVKDNGVGFDMKYADKLFGVFQRLHKVNEYEGTGIGLALVQRIVHKNGGKVWAESEPGVGSVFYFTLRCKK